VQVAQVAWPAASCADSQFAGQPRLVGGGEGGDFRVLQRYPLDLAPAPNGVDEPIQAVTGCAVNAPDPRRDKDIGKLVGNHTRHICSLFCGFAPR
jgi:hypothetical protein